MQKALSKTQAAENQYIFSISLSLRLHALPAGASPRDYNSGTPDSDHIILFFNFAKIMLFSDKQ